MRIISGSVECDEKEHKPDVGDTVEQLSELQAGALTL